MKTILTTLSATLLMVPGYSAFAQASSPVALHLDKPAQMKMGASMKSCKEMMAEMEKDKAHMKEMDAIVDKLVVTMDSATGEDKVNAMSAVVKELVAQRGMTRRMKEVSDSKMMAHMMEHMNMPMKSGKMDCPMMKGMKGMKGM